MTARTILRMGVWARTAAYEAAVSNWFAGELGKGGATEPPRYRSFAGYLKQKLRYGENPQLRAAFYLPREDKLPEQLWGKTLSYNNLLDLDACLRLLVEAPIPIGLDRAKLRPDHGKLDQLSHRVQPLLIVDKTL